MSNLFFRTNLVPYRIDTYNALHKLLGCQFYFYWKEEPSQNLNMDIIKQQCIFIPHYLKGFVFGKRRRKFCSETWKILSQNKPDIVIVPEFQLLTLQVILYKYLFRKSIKIISMCDDSYDMVVNNNDFTQIHKWARKIITPLLDNILLVDKNVEKWYRLNYKKGIWLPIIRDEEKEIEAYKKVLPISNEFNNKFNLQGKKILLFVGRLVKLKNITNLLKAIESTQSDFTTVIVGTGEEEEFLKEKASLIKKEILFVGHFEGNEIRAWYNIADVFILPSYQEPFGAVTNEALIAGCYSIISEKAGSSCLISSKNGMIINPYDVKTMAKNIDIAMNRFHTKGKQIVVKKSLMDIKFQDKITKVIEEITS